MTLHYLQTARINAKPLARHIDTPEQQAPVYTDLDAMIADMMADAKAIRKRVEDANMRDTVHEQVDDGAIVQAVKASPGMTVDQIAAAICKPVKSARYRAKALVRHGVLKSQNVKRGRVYAATYYPKHYVLPKSNNRRPSPVRDKVIAYIKANPGCSTYDIAEHMGCSSKAATDYVTAVRRVVKLRSERSPNEASHVPARHWVEDEE